MFQRQEGTTCLHRPGVYRITPRKWISQKVHQGTHPRQGTNIITQGGFAECYELVSQETGKRYAAKVIDKETLSKGKTKEKL